jgi:hypothetical protein
MKRTITFACILMLQLARGQMHFYRFDPQYPVGFGNISMAEDVDNSLISAGILSPQSGPPSVRLARSTDGGLNWTLIQGNPLPYGGPYYLTVVGSTILLIHDNGGANAINVYRSVDGAMTWSLATTGLPTNTLLIGAMTADGSGNLFIVARRKGVSGPLVRVYKSTNAGSSWTETPVTIGAEWDNTFNITGMGFHSGTLYVSYTYSNNKSRILTSNNGGAAWTVSLDINVHYSPVGFFVSSNDIHFLGQPPVGQIALLKNWAAVAITGIDDMTQFFGTTQTSSALFLRGETGANQQILYTNVEPVGISANAPAAPFGLYPNPSGETLYISHPNGSEALRVFSSTGEIVLSIPGSASSVDISPLSQGIYYVRSATGETTAKFIKQ